MIVWVAEIIFFFFFGEGVFVCVFVGGVRVRGCDSSGVFLVFSFFWFGGVLGVIGGWMEGCMDGGSWW